MQLRTRGSVFHIGRTVTYGNVNDLVVYYNKALGITSTVATLQIVNGQTGAEPRHRQRAPGRPEGRAVPRDRALSCIAAR
jgi:hypothetical protein